MSRARDVTTVGTATLLSRLLGFFRDVGIAAVLGAGVLSDAFFAALQIPNLFRRLLAEGALNSAFVPMWMRIREDGGVVGMRRFGEQVLGTGVSAGTTPRWWRPRSPPPACRVTCWKRCSAPSRSRTRICATLAILVAVGLGVCLAAVEFLGIARLAELRDSIRGRF